MEESSSSSSLGPFSPFNCKVNERRRERDGFITTDYGDVTSLGREGKHEAPLLPSDCLISRQPSLPRGLVPARKLRAGRPSSEES